VFEDTVLKHIGELKGGAVAEVAVEVDRQRRVIEKRAEGLAFRNQMLSEMETSLNGQLVPRAED